MKRLLRPTLVRRVVLALLIAFALVWVVLMAHQFYNATDQQAFDKNLKSLGDNVLASIAPIETTSEARAVVASTATLINNSYRSNQAPGAVLMELRDAQGQRLFFSPEGGRARLHATPGQIDSTVINDQEFRLYLVQNARWSLLVAAPRLNAWWIIGSMSGGMTIDMLIAFPFVLLPVWIAVTRGLRPLRKLSTHIAAKGPDDLSALGIEQHYDELAPLTKAIDHLLGQLRHKLAREHGFVQDAAHELRTPLAVISAQAHVLAMTTDATQRAEAERRMTHAVARASHLIVQLLDLAQMDSHPSPTSHTLDVAQLLQQELAQVAPTAMSRNIELSLDAPDALHYRLDVHAFQSIVHNLLNNALAYIQEYGQVHVTLKAVPNGLRLSVADDGPGIAPEKRALVFERFYRGSGHDAPGAGLGLSIVREAVARLHGSVSLAEGIGGKGCSFIATIGTKDGDATAPAA
jgi:signal transduction histidine kinase